MLPIKPFELFSLKCGVALLAVFALFLVWIMQWSNIDLWLADMVYRPEAHAFVLKNSWFADVLMHKILKNCIIFFGVIWIVITLIDLARPFEVISQRFRARMRFVALSAIVIPSVISSLKHFSSLQCPWNIDRYGGYAPYVRLFDAVPKSIEAGQCFPAGHASTGLWLAAFCIFMLPNAPKKAFFIFMLSLSIGFAMGWVQQMRGAHFLSHTLWSLWIASAIILCMLLMSNILNIKLD